MNKFVKGKNYFEELKELQKYAVCELTGVKVTAIIVTDQGIFKGVNYENIVLSLSTCAERNAIYNGITNGMRRIYEIHFLPTIDIAMCGSCRQLSACFSSKSTAVYQYTLSGKRKHTTLGKLLPNGVFEY